jgi:hypothetical protein
MHINWDLVLLYVIQVCASKLDEWKRMSLVRGSPYMQPRGWFLTSGDTTPALEYRSMKTREAKCVLCGSDKLHAYVAFAFGGKVLPLSVTEETRSGLFRYSVVRTCGERCNLYIQWKT